MNTIIKSKIIEYVSDPRRHIDQVIVFGEALTNNSENTIIRLAVTFDDKYDVDGNFGYMLTFVDEITNGHFELLTMNGDNLTSDALAEIGKGVIIYDSSSGEKT